MSKRVPTDLRILKAIYSRYYSVFSDYGDGTTQSRSSKIYVPIDIAAIAHDLSVDEDIVFGRLYYHLDHRWAYRQDDGADVHFFALRIGGDTHCVNFPFMASVLADLQDQAARYNTAIWIAVGSLVVSVASIVISICLRG